MQAAAGRLRECHRHGTNGCMQARHTAREACRAASPTPRQPAAHAGQHARRLTGPMCWNACRGPCSGRSELLLLPAPPPVAPAAELLPPAAACCCCWRRSQQSWQRLKARPSSWQVVHRYLRVGALGLGLAAHIQTGFGWTGGKSAGRDPGWRLTARRWGQPSCALARVPTAGKGGPGLTPHPAPPCAPVLPMRRVVPPGPQPLAAVVDGVVAHAAVPDLGGATRAQGCYLGLGSGFIERGGRGDVEGRQLCLGRPGRAEALPGALNHPCGLGSRPSTLARSVRIPSSQPAQPTSRLLPAAQARLTAGTAGGPSSTASARAGSTQLGGTCRTCSW